MDEPIDFYSNVTSFWHEVVPAIEQLHLEPQYRVLLQPCTMCQYPYKVPFYIILIVLVSISIFPPTQSVLTLTEDTETLDILSLVASRNSSPFIEGQPHFSHSFVANNGHLDEMRTMTGTLGLP